MFSSIVVGTDGSATAAAAVDEAVALAAKSGARLVVVSAYEPVSNSRPRSEHEAFSEEADWMVPRDEVLAVLERARATAVESGIGEVETFARQGDAADAIIDIAEEQGCDLIVVGSKGMTGAKRFLLGSVPNKVSHHAPCSVLIVRTS